jgi:N-methylhydantoinase A/acetone carboxylase beta subunit
MSRRTRVLAIDTGGTMTDTFIVSDKGEYVVGKAQTTPEDESVSLVNSAKDALQYWDMSVGEAFPQLISAVYSGTTMINRLLERKGKKIGLIVTAGMEDYLRLERGRQTWLAYSYSDRLHVVTHEHNVPLVPLERIRGIRGRIDVFGEEALPLNRQECKQIVGELLEKNVDCLCINLLFSYRSPKHERTVRDIALEVMEEKGIQVPIFLSSELYPVRGDFPRLNTLLIEAYAAEPSREQLHKVRQKTRGLGASCDLRIMASHGGTISIEARELAKSLISGPIGGVIGGNYLAKNLGVENVVCSDIGGTSFDLALITAGEYDIKTTPNIARFLLKLPTVRIESIGAGTGSFVRIDPNSNRIEIGPDSAGSKIGVCYEEGGITTTTITDCHVALGLINPDYFLGGEIKINKERAYHAIKEQIADPLGLDVYEAATGAVEILEDTLRNHVEAMVMGKGYAVVNFALLSYGGGGPLHVAGYTEGLEFEDILVPSWAAGFSAFGCACADFEYRYDHTIDLAFNPTASDTEKMQVAEKVNQTWEMLKKQVAQEFEKSGVKEEQIEYCGYLRMQYMGQLEDLEIASPATKITQLSDWDEIVSRFEELYSRVYSRSARSPELGYFLTTAIITGRLDVEKPQFVVEELQSPKPPEKAFKGYREAFWKGKWIKAKTFEMDRLQAGNLIDGLAIIESPSTTFVIPPGRTATMDQHRIFHLSNSV